MRGRGRWCRLGRPRLGWCWFRGLRQWRRRFNLRRLRLCPDRRDVVAAIHASLRAVVDEHRPAWRDLRCIIGSRGDACDELRAFDRLHSRRLPHIVLGRGGLASWRWTRGVRGVRARCLPVERATALVDVERGGLRSRRRIFRRAGGLRYGLWTRLPNCCVGERCSRKSRRSSRRWRRRRSCNYWWWRGRL